MNTRQAIEVVREARDCGWNPKCVTCEIRHEDRPELAEAVAVLEADARALWAVRVLVEANNRGHHISFPYQRGDEWLMIDSPERWQSSRDTMHRGATAELCMLAAAEAVFPELPADVRAKLGERP